MGFFSSVFTNVSNGWQGKGRNPYFQSRVTKNRKQKRKGGYAGGWAAIAFGNIINAHASPDDIVDEFAMDKEEAQYGDAYARAYEEEYKIASDAYQDFCDLYYEEIADFEARRQECLDTAEQLREEAEALLEEAEALMEEAEMSEDPDEIADLKEEAQELREQAQQLIEEAEMFEVEAVECELTVMELYAELETFTVEDFIDWDEVDIKARDYALEIAERWIAGEEWIPEEVLDWSFYSISSHNL